jgi:hypothetical protein
MSGRHAVPEAFHVPPTARADGWYSDPMEPNGQRYWRAGRWTFWTTRPKTDGQRAEEADVLERERHALGLPNQQEHRERTAGAGGISWVGEVSDRAFGDQAAAAQDASQQLRQDIAEAKARMSGLGIGAGKEIRLLGGYLRPEEQVRPTRSRDLPLGESQVGDRHLNFHDIRGNLRSGEPAPAQGG